MVRSKLAVTGLLPVIRRVDVLGQKVSADGNGVEILIDVPVKTEGALIRDVQHRAEANVLLHAKARAANLRQPGVAGPLSDGLGSEDSARAGQRAELAIVCGRRVHDGWVARHAIHFIAVQAVVEHAHAAADGSLAVAEHVIGETEARSKGERGGAV